MSSSDTRAVHWGFYVRCIHSWTSQPLRTEEEAEQFVFWVLFGPAIAKRTGQRSRRTKKPLMGMFECIQGKCPYRGSNFTERLYVAFAALREAGYSSKLACCILADIPSVRTHLGHSRRGRLSKLRMSDSGERRAETIRGLCARFKSPFKQELLRMRVGDYRCFQLFQAGIADYAGFSEQVRKLISDEPPCYVGQVSVSNPSDSQDED